jgi:hypothetical protein
MITYIPAREIVPTDIVLYGSGSNSQIVFGSTVDRISEYDETIYVEYDDGWQVPFGIDETVTVIRPQVSLEMVKAFEPDECSPEDPCHLC